MRLVALLVATLVEIFIPVWTPPLLAQSGSVRKVSGWVYPAADEEVAGVLVRARFGDATDSVEVDGGGRFVLHLPSSPEPGAVLEIATVDTAGRFFPSLRRVRRGGEGEVLLILVPRRWRITAGSYAGMVVPIDPVAARTPACRRCGSFYRSEEGDTLPGRPRGIPTWPDSVFPLRVAFDDEEAPLSARDTSAFWDAARVLESDLGRPLFAPAPLELVLDPPEGDSQGSVLVSIDPTLRTAGLGNSASQGGDILASAVILQRSTLLAGATGIRLLSHELLHVLGFGHTCAWRSVLNDFVCPGRSTPRATPEDVAHVQLLFRIRAAERVRHAPGAVDAVVGGR